mgnify:CR=1 FL=1
MFERRIQKQLHEWAEKNNRKPLILRGARQVGKTTIVEQFGKEFDNFLSLNLEKKEAKDLFESTDDVKMLLPLLFLYDNKPQRPGRTLLFIDEIQSSPQAVALLRYFYEELPEGYTSPAIFFPIPDVETYDVSLDAHSYEYSWFVKIFDVSDTKAWEAGEKIQRL